MLLINCHLDWWYSMVCIAFCNCYCFSVVLIYFVHNTMFSLKKRFTALEETIKAYPIATALLVALAWLVLTLIRDWTYIFDDAMLTRFTKMIMVWFVFVFASVAITKRLRWDVKRHALWQWLLLAAIIVYYAVLPGSLDTAPQTTAITHMLIQWVAVALLLVAPLWTAKRRDDAMYKGLIQLILHACLAGIFSLVLAWWISWALAWIEALFDVEIASEWYPSLFATIGIVFWGLTFLDWIRQRKINDKSTIKKDKWKTLLWWVIGVLLLVYGLILYAYLAKILMTGEWPSNQVTWLGFAFSGFVVVGSILLVPLITDKKKALTRQRLLNWMYISLIPILGMVFFAIKLRVDQYGITEMRYLVCLLLIWLLWSSLYMIISKKKDIRWVAALLTWLSTIAFVWGLISAWGVAEHCQKKRLNTLVSTYNVLDSNWMLDKELLSGLNSDEKDEIAWTIRYLVDFHWPESVSDYITTSSKSGYTVVNDLWIWGYWGLRNDDGRVYFNVWGTKENVIVPVTGYDRLYSDVRLYKSDKQKSLSDEIVISLSKNELLIALWDASPIVIDLAALMEDSKDSEIFFHEQDSLWFSIDYMHGYREWSDVEVEGIEFDLLR